MLRNVIQQLRRLVVDNDLDPFPLAGTLRGYGTVSYTHLTLPTMFEV